MKEAIRKSNILIEALPYIIDFNEKIIVVKYGGSAMKTEEVRKGIFQDLIFMNLCGIQPIIVHGGGPFISQKMKDLGREPKFVNGLRVTEEMDIQIVNKVLTDINKSIVKEITELGGKAYSLSGKDGIIQVERRLDLGDIGYVGNIVSIDTTPIETVLLKKHIPVISPLGLGVEDHLIHNVNADDASCEIAIALKALKIALLTDVDGVMTHTGDIISSIDLEGVQSNIERDAIKGGMLPKVNACIHALQNGVSKAHIINGNISHALLLEIFTKKGIGTEIVLE